MIQKIPGNLLRTAKNAKILSRNFTSRTQIIQDQKIYCPRRKKIGQRRISRREIEGIHKQINP